MKPLLRLLIALPLAAAGLNAAAQETKWETYEGGRFDVRLDYPSSIFIDPSESANGDGAVFKSRPSGAALRVW